MPGNSKYSAALTASSVYLVCEGLRVVSGFVTMPVLTRTLTKEDYGLLTLTFATVGILAVFGRLGFAEATTRFYFEYKQRGRRELGAFCATMLTGALGTSTLVALLMLVALQWAVSDVGARRCLQVASLVVVIRCVLGVVYQTYRAQERPLAFSGAQLASRYVSLAIVLVLLLLGDLTTYRVILATIVGEGLVAVVTIAESAARGILALPRFSREHFDAAFTYGAPLAVGLYASFFLDFGDRFLIERFLGLGAVATYAVPYDLFAALATAVFGSLKLALMPVVFRTWETEGRAATSDFVSRIFTYALALAIPGTVLYIATSEDLIVLLSSTKYSGASELTAYLAPGVLISELNFLVAAGLLITGGTKTVAVLSLASGALNMLLNLLLLPRWGLVGAASATSISYGALMLTTYVASRSSLELRVQPMVIAAAIVTTAIMLGSLSFLGQVSRQPLVNLVLRGGAGAAITVLCMSVLTPEIRQHTWMRALGYRADLRSVE